MITNYNIPGASSGIGRAVCNLFAKEGAKVVAADINIKAAEETVSNLLGDINSKFHTFFRKFLVSNQKIILDFCMNFAGSGYISIQVYVMIFPKMPKVLEVHFKLYKIVILVQQ